MYILLGVKCETIGEAQGALTLPNLPNYPDQF